ncbi:glutathione S-transferase family protein [Tepidamorphus sp. 3E244]|uniref:glutathione S-transferase family protein n=1 Tax=Tepidamorphus sp. 3E244 TaxID=3385498 RepID=UPI0038FCF24D
MTIEFYGHPFSSYTQKAKIALYEHDVVFELHSVDPELPENRAEYQRIWPMKRFPVLVDDGVPVFEATIIVEYIDLKYSKGQRLLPANASEALHTRMMDRIFDNYVMTPTMSIVFTRIHENPDGFKGFETPEELLDRSYDWLDKVMAERTWAAGETFSLADCAAAPSLFYADWVRPIPKTCANVRAYREQLLAHPTVARCVEEARPYRHYFPGGAPDQD